MTTEHSQTKILPALYQVEKHVPDYRTATPEVQEILDTMIAELNPQDIETAVTFGNDAQAQRRAVAERIFEAYGADQFSFIRDPLEKTLEAIQGIDLEDISNRIGQMTQKGVKVAGRNKMALGLTFLGAAVVGPLALIPGAAAIGLNETARNLKDKANKMRRGPKTLEEIETELRDGLAQFKPMVQELEATRTKIPAIRQNVMDLGRANLESLTQTTLRIAAGQEALRRFGATAKQLNDDSNESEARALTVFSENLGQKLAIHEQARAHAIMDITKLGDLVQATNDNDLAIESILTHEIGSHRASLAANAVVADTLRTSRIINNFRTATEQSARQAMQAADMARTVAASNRVDSPERLQALVENLKDVQKLLSTRLESLPAIGSRKETLRNEINTAIGTLVNTQAESAKAHLGLKNDARTSPPPALM